MVLYLHELKRSRLSLIIWSLAVAYMLAICVFIYPEMGSQMDEMSAMFADMGAFTEAFGMDQVNFGEFLGFFSVECGEMLGIGGGIFAAIVGIGALAKEENDKTADFLLTHPVPRRNIVLSKLLSAVTQIVIFNVVIIGITAVSILAIGEEPSVKKLALIFLSYFILQLELAFICFALSAFMKKKAMGLGIGLSLGLYFVNIVSNITEEAEFLKFVTPYSYTETAYIMENESLEAKFLLIGAAVAAISLFAAFKKYTSKDIAN